MGKKKKGTFLKVALVWNSTILKEEAFLKPKTVTVGEDSKSSLFTIYSEKVELGNSFNLFTLKENNKYQLNLLETMEGDIRLGDEEYDLKKFMQEKCKKNGSSYTYSISTSDSGNIDIGEQTLSWRFIEEVPVALGGALKFDKNFAFHLLIVAILHAMIALYVSAMETVDDELSFADIPDRFAQVMIEELEEDKKEDEDKKKKGRKKENIGKRMGGKLGKIGDKKTPKYIKTKIPKARRELITKSLKARGVFGAMSNAGFTDLTDNSGPNVADRLQASFNGTSGDEFVAGRGSGGAGFRGTGTGGGGTGYGRIGGTGDIDTGGGRGTKVSLSKGRKGERKVPKLRKGRASFSGFCKKSNIQKVVSKKSRSIRYCYEKELQRSRGLKGKVKLVWIIGMDGKVESVSASQDTVKNSRMTSCLKRQVKRWRFDKPKGGKCKIAYPFIFTAD